MTTRSSCPPALRLAAGAHPTLCPVLPRAVRDPRPRRHSPSQGPAYTHTAHRAGSASSSDIDWLRKARKAGLDEASDAWQPRGPGAVRDAWMLPGIRLVNPADGRGPGDSYRR